MGRWGDQNKVGRLPGEDGVGAEEATMPPTSETLSLLSGLALDLAENINV